MKLETILCAFFIFITIGQTRSLWGAQTVSFQSVLEGAKKDGELNLWSNTPEEETMPKILEAFNKRFGGNVRFRNDNFGSKIYTLDVGWGNRTFAFRGAFINQLQKTRRINIGNDLDGQYVQLAWRPFDNTVIRLSGTQTWKPCDG